MSGRYGVNPEALDAAVRSLRAVSDQLMELGSHGDEQTGSSIENLALDSDQVASEKVHVTLADLLERGHYLMAPLQEAVQEVVGRLADTRNTYELQEAANASEFTWDPMGQEGQR